MVTVDCSTEMSKYHKEEVTLQNADQDTMRRRRDAGRTGQDRAGARRPSAPQGNRIAGVLRDAYDGAGRNAITTLMTVTISPRRI